MAPRKRSTAMVSTSIACPSPDDTETWSEVFRGDTGTAVIQLAPTVTLHLFPGSASDVAYAERLAETLSAFVAEAREASR